MGTIKQCRREGQHYIYIQFPPAWSMCILLLQRRRLLVAFLSRLPHAAPAPHQPSCYPLLVLRQCFLRNRVPRPRSVVPPKRYEIRAYCLGRRLMLVRRKARTGWATLFRHTTLRGPHLDAFLTMLLGRVPMASFMWRFCNPTSKTPSTTGPHPRSTVFMNHAIANPRRGRNPSVASFKILSRA